MFTARDLALMQAAQEAAFPDLVNIRRPVLIEDGMGGYDRGVPEVVAVDVPARVTQAQVLSFYDKASRDLEEEKWTVRLPIGTEVQDRDLIDWVDHSLTIAVQDVRDRSFATCVTIEGGRIKEG